MNALRRSGCRLQSTAEPGRESNQRQLRRAAISSSSVPQFRSATLVPSHGWRHHRCSGVSCRASREQQASRSDQPSLLTLYPSSSPRETGYLQVSDLHTIYYEVHGNPQGMPAVVLHGGPGAGCYANHARFFDLNHYQVVLLDQRGCGRSTPRGCLVDNDTCALVADLDLLRRHLRLPQWLLFGGSWGVTVALAYAQSHPDRVLGMVLRGVCMMRLQEVQWMYGGGGGAAALKPWAWERFAAHVDASGSPAAVLLAYYERLLSAQSDVRDRAASHWMQWNMGAGTVSFQGVQCWDGREWATAEADASLRPPPSPAAVAPVVAAPAVDQAAAQQAPTGVSPRFVPASADTVSPSPAQREPMPSVAGSHGVAMAPMGAALPADRQRTVEQLESLLRATAPVPSGLEQHYNPAAAPAAAAASTTHEASKLERLQAIAFSYRGDPALSHSTAQALLECHYSLHAGFAHVMQHVSAIHHIPAIAVHGAQDYVCPLQSAFDLHRAWPQLELRVVPGAGHSMYDPTITDQLVQATNRMRGLAWGAVNGTEMGYN